MPWKVVTTDFSFNKEFQTKYELNFSKMSQPGSLRHFFFIFSLEEKHATPRVELKLLSMARLAAERHQMLHLIYPKPAYIEVFGLDSFFFAWCKQGPRHDATTARAGISSAAAT